MEADRRVAGALLLAGCVPLAAGAAWPLQAGEPAAAPLPCPFRAVTGLPCPLCGATRAVVLAAHGDPAFLRYNAVWVAVLVALALAGAAALVGAARLPRLPARGRVVLLTLLLAAVPWAYALAQRDTITG